MKKTILIQLSKSYQKVEVAVEFDIADGEIDENAIKAALFIEARDMLGKAIVTTNELEVVTEKKTNQPVQNANGAQGKQLSQRQVEILKENNLWHDDITYDEGRALLDEHFANKPARQQPYNHNNGNYGGNRNNYGGNRGNYNGNNRRW